uniref:Uncharacterized protein n=1 Tax=Romanomermis culicivorax TaxID=13658 RepID=A0A915HNW6_ROMCU
MCLVKLPFKRLDLPQNLHTYGFKLVCTDRCSAKLDRKRKALPHISQFDSLRKYFGQVEQVKYEPLGSTRPTGIEPSLDVAAGKLRLVTDLCISICDKLIGKIVSYKIMIGSGKASNTTLFGQYLL